jgi:hypothetical protein
MLITSRRSCLQSNPFFYLLGGSTRVSTDPYGDLDPGRASRARERRGGLAWL